ncbi:phospholipase domain-containing protein, partial [Streptomyces beijiangensis]
VEVRTRGVPATGRFALTFSGGDSAGAHFYVTSANRTDGPWTYTTEAGKKISDTWNAAYSKGSYDLTAHGPNGFLPTFKGPGSTAGGKVVRTVDLARTQRWYDLTVVSDKDAGFLRRLAGHVENGRPGVSDPAIITG